MKNRRDTYLEKLSALLKLSLLCSCIAVLSACSGSSNDSASETSDDDDIDIREINISALPLEIIEPADNPTTPEKVALGKMLFWDPLLSGNQDVACATCHHPDHGYAENIDLSIGVGGHGLSEERDFGVLIKRNAPTVVNTAYNGINLAGEYDPSDTVMFWDNRAQSLEEQALGPIQSLEEMRGEHFTEEEILGEIESRLAANAEYQTLFIDAFGDDTISADRIAKALAVFQRSLVANNSPFDRYMRGDDSALTDQELEGAAEFIESGCNTCHGGPMFSDFSLHNLAVDTNGKLEREGIVDNGVDGQFRTPSLRNVELTAPYMHNGTERTLRQAIAFYDDIENPSNDPLLEALDFDPSNEDIANIEAFLRALTDESFDKTIPDQVPSGLNPGGNI